MLTTCTTAPLLWPLFIADSLCVNKSALVSFTHFGAVQGRASVGHLHVDVAAVAAASTLTLSARASQLSFVTVGTLQCRARVC